MPDAQAQVSCLLAEKDGWQYMDIYDSMPADVRQRIAASPYNLCAACVFTGSIGGNFNRTIDRMERTIRCQECGP